MDRQNLWAPWRMEYLREIAAPAPPTTKPSACFLCEMAALEPGSTEAKRRFLIHRDERGMILLNLYPYTNGHLLISLAEHLGDLLDLTPAQRAGIIELTALGEELLKAAINPQGVNVGINL